MSQEKLLITGASGMLGGRLAERAKQDGYHVKAMVRPTSQRDHLDALGVELVEADLSRPETLPAALDDVDVVIHSAAHVGDWGPPEKFRAINVEALEHMVTEAKRRGSLKRWIQISSLGVYAACHHHGTDETTPCSVTGLDGYTRTKAEAEIVLKRHIEQDQFPAVILRPGFMYGRGDRHVIPAIIERIKKGQLKMIGDGTKLLNNTYVGNFIDGIMLALNKEGIEGETFNMRDERLVPRTEFLGTICDYVGEPHPKKVPEWLARGVVGLFEGVAKARGATKAPLLTRARIKFMTLNLDFSVEKAKRVLGYQPQVDFQDGIKEALDWAKEEKIIS